MRGTAQEIDFDLIAGRYRLFDGRMDTELQFPMERNDMFLGAMRDFLKLVRGEAIGDGAGVPRLDLVAGTCRAIAAAWQARQFSGRVEGSYA